MKQWIGIDPGKQGGLAIVSTKAIYVLAMPNAGKDIDLSIVADWLVDHLWCDKAGKTNAVAVIEKVGAMPGQGVTSMFSFGFGTGAMHGLLAAMKIPRYVVTPQAWKKHILVGTNKDKEAAVDFCRKAFPSISLLATPRSKKAHDGMADAICIALYAKTKL